MRGSNYEAQQIANKKETLINFQGQLGPSIHYDGFGPWWDLR